jgi:hypothetical protein
MNFNTIANLRASTVPAANEIAFVLGYYAPGDGGGGEFYWNASSIAVDDGGVTIPITGTATGRWIRTVTTDVIDVRWFGAKGDNATNDTARLQACADYIKNNATLRRIMYFSSGYYKTDRVNITGVFMIRGNGERTTVIGNDGQDILYWSGPGEAGYVVVQQLYISDLILNVSGVTDVRNNYTRIGFGGERIGNCAILIPTCVGINFDKIRINGAGGPGPGYGHCGIFFSGAPYQVNFGSKVEIRNTDYGVICGTSETWPDLLPVIITAADGITGTFTAINSYGANAQVALVFDANDASLSNITPRSIRYYVVNPTATSFQVSATAGGAPITFTFSGAFPIYAVPAGADSVEYACDEWAWEQLATVTKRVGFSVVNLAYSQLGTFGCQSNYVSVRLLNYQSVTRNGCYNCHFDEMYTEGPLYQTIMIGKEWARIEGTSITVENGPYCNTSVALNNRIVVNTRDSHFNGLNVKNNMVQILGHRNRIRGKFEEGASNVSDLGQDNRVYFMRRSNGDAPGAPQQINPRSIDRDRGGFWPDFVRTGNALAPYISDRVLFQPAAEQLFQGTPSDVSYLYDDATLEINGYVRKAASGQLSMRTALGNNRNVLLINKYFPKSRWRLYAKVRSNPANISPTQNISIGLQGITGTGTNYSQTYVVGTAWQLIYVDCDHTTATDNYSIQINVSAASDSFDFVYYYILPYEGESFTLKTNYGGGVYDLAGTGSPETVVAAGIGSTYRRRDGAAGSTFYVKQAGAGNTGWAAIG